MSHFLTSSRSFCTRIQQCLFVWLFALATLVSAQAAEYRPLPLAPRSGLSADWLIHDATRNRLVLYLPDYHAPAHAYYQWLSLNPARPFLISFAAREGQSLFLDNRLVFTAAATASYTLDLGRLLPKGTGYGTHLLCVWHPEVAPNLSSFTDALVRASSTAINKPVRTAFAQPLTRSHPGENVFLCFLLLIGLLYGSIRATYQPGFARIYQLEGLWSRSTAQQDFLVKPTVTWLNILLVLVFSLSFALLLVAIHTNVQNIVILRRLFDVPESALVARVLLYTSLIAGFILGKYLFLELLGYIFDVGELVLVQYREFIRTILFLGLFLPMVMLLYLGLNQTLPETVLWVSNGVVSLLLIGTVIRVARTLHRKASLLNLHLFSYLCATEVIPLVILLKLIVFTY
ncbi:DUF4271 domain-containing protein [Hymenobacter sp. BT186]|uniref:DUF4271 domain-containing protein n=1 Tax=Hymenobacter telluris TaxID=2816474 RepID=A0A939EW29_9BACT|nr:DUF4271 domain-containing protein [Hymenobacter telluris]MBO0358261.1 DUF4271 domain-containing protein [Hymenobacter telluris]MBW3374287.1 DUF4271 domain-containing protein [Hymenobacter norwichensis]